MSLRRSLGWSLVGLVGIGAVGASVIGVRQYMQRGELESAMARSAEDAAWLTSLPRVEPELRERAWQWMKTPWPGGSQGRGTRGEDWYLEGREAPAELRAQHAAEREHMAKLSALLDHDGICLSSAAWAEPDAPRSAAIGAQHIPNLLSCRGAVRWYGTEAMLAEDPRQALGELDRFLEALQPACGLIDTMILVALDAMRDRIYLRLVYRDALPEEGRERWLDETCGALTWYRDAFRAERLLVWTPLADAVLRNAPKAKRALYGDSTNGGEEFDFAWHARRDAAHVIQAWQLYEDYVVGRCDADALDVIETWKREGGRTAEISLPSYSSMIWVLASVQAQHRLTRLVGRTLKLDGAPPASERELTKRLPGDVVLDAVARFDLAIRYQRVDADRVRFYVPQDAALPDLLEAQRAQLGIRLDGLDRPAHLDKTLLSWSHGLALEAKLPR